MDKDPEHFFSFRSVSPPLETRKKKWTWGNPDQNDKHDWFPFQMLSKKGFIQQLMETNAETQMQTLGRTQGNLQNTERNACWSRLGQGHHKKSNRISLTWARGGYLSHRHLVYHKGIILRKSKQEAQSAGAAMPENSWFCFCFCFVLEFWKSWFVKNIFFLKVWLGAFFCLRASVVWHS